MKLGILCLHGFRQNASGFKGRLGSFMKKLKHLAEFVFVDAPHGLPFIVQPRPTQFNGDAAQFPGKMELLCPVVLLWHLLCSHYQEKICMVGYEKGRGPLILRVGDN